MSRIFSSNDTIEIPFPDDKFNKYLSILKIENNDLNLVNIELIFAISFKDFKVGINSLDEFSEISNHLLSRVDRAKTPPDFVTALDLAAELNFYIRNVRDAKDTSVPDFMTTIENYFKIIRPTLLDQVKKFSLKNLPPEPVFIMKSLPKEKVYSVLLSQLNEIENSTISIDEKNIERATNNSMGIGFKLFPLIDSIALTLFKKTSGRYYLKKLGYSREVVQMIYSVFRNGIIHTLKPYRFEYKDGVITWGLSSSSGSSGFSPYDPGYIDIKNPEFNIPADTAFNYHKFSNSSFHASLSLNILVAQIKYDLNIRQKDDERDLIDIVVGQKINGKIPTLGN